MARVTFIRFYSTLTQALQVWESPFTEQFEYRGIQLLPNNPLPYVQTTANPLGVSLEDWDVEVYGLRGQLLGNITNEFFVDRVFTDDNGMPQIDWSIKDTPLDCGYELVYLKISQAVGQTFYTNPFQLTENDSEFTARFDYRFRDDDTMQSIQTQTWFRQHLNRDELTTYYEASTRNTVTKALKTATIQKWHTELFNNSLFIDFRNMLNSRIVYCELVRANLYEPIEVPELTAKENFAETTFMLTFNDSDVYDPLYVAPVIPAPVVGDGVTVGVRIFKTPRFDPPNEFSYRAVFRFAPVQNFNIIIEGGSYVTFDIGYDSTIGINMTLSNSSMLIASNQVGTVPLQANVGIKKFNLKTANISFETLALLYDSLTDPILSFTDSDIDNGIEKQIQATLV